MARTGLFVAATPPRRVRLKDLATTQRLHAAEHPVCLGAVGFVFGKPPPLRESLRRLPLCGINESCPDVPSPVRNLRLRLNNHQT
jgi:hypothetical protein